MKKNIPNSGGSPMGITSSLKQDIYFVKQGETLESISWELTLENPKYLREYHNSRCSYLDLIPEEGTLRFLQKLNVPNSDEIRKINEQIRKSGESLCYLLPMGKISFNIELIDGNYEVRQTESYDGTQQSEYSYTLHFKYIKEDEKGHYVEFTMNNFKKNEEEPEEKINNLASDFVKIVYPITLIIDKSGNFVKANPIKEVKDITTELETLKQYYAGSYATSHIDQMKSKMMTPQIIYNSLKETLPLQFIFNQFYKANYHSKDTTASYRDEFSWLAPASPIRLEMVHQILPQSSSNLVEIIQTGRSVDYRTVPELYYTDLEYDEQIIPHSKSVKANHSATYTLDFMNFSIQKIKARFDIQIADYEKTMTFELEKLLG
ncbi:hypothetical protein H5J24_05990 [Chryseobacterium capnotolerans]|uniref:hypothetical protein n=1 Tax=Chryseobacterium TaxID=59732 RepID=UPI000839E619|nr:MULTISPECIES: hypothetical protein [Chryseobacterium]UHO39628.1 hypothetical protein H5J24_05990 [Chryseobacterium capnotolerans]